MKNLTKFFVLTALLTLSYGSYAFNPMLAATEYTGFDGQYVGQLELIHENRIGPSYDFGETVQFYSGEMGIEFHQGVDGVHFPKIILTQEDKRIEIPIKANLFSTKDMMMFIGKEQSKLNYGLVAVRIEDVDTRFAIEEERYIIGVYPNLRGDKTKNEYAFGTRDIAVEYATSEKYLSVYFLDDGGSPIAKFTSQMVRTISRRPIIGNFK